jgi:hypothetical protein
VGAIPARLAIAETEHEVSISWFENVLQIPDKIRSLTGKKGVKQTGIDDRVKGFIDLIQVYGIPDQNTDLNCAFPCFLPCFFDGGGRRIDTSDSVSEGGEIERILTCPAPYIQYITTDFSCCASCTNSR